MASASCYAALASLTELLNDILHRDRYPKFLLASARQHILNSLHQKFTFLLESSDKGYSSKRAAVEEADDDLETRIRDVAYRVQDIIQTEITKQIHRESRGTNEIVMTFQQLISPFQNIFHLLQLNLEKRDEEVDSIVKAVMEIQESPRSEALQLGYYSTGDDASQPQPAPSGTINTVVGLDEHIFKMKEFLCGGSHNLQAISIVGMGGIGKTTLAKCIYDDALIVHHFDYRVWITISQEHSLNEFLREILLSLGNKSNEVLGENEMSLMEHVYKCLVGRRYLMVLDDVWTQEFWDVVRRTLPNDVNGSRIVLTTRLSEVGMQTGGIIYRMPFLTEDNSWSLLKQKVFGQENCPPELQNIGRIIARNCQGLPLSIIVTANTLFNNRTEAHWKMVAERMDPALSTSDGGILMDIMSQSYDTLPPQLKACFLYIGHFPEDSRINISKLTKMWIAEGFLKPNDGSKTSEQVAEDCVLELVNRSLVQVTQRRANGNIKYCTSMHDIMRDFCLYRDRREKFLHAISGRENLYAEKVESVRRVCSYQNDRLGSQLYDFGKLVSSILIFGECGKFDTKTWDRLKLLKVLGTYKTTWPIPDAIFQMFHLKYLDLYVDGLRWGVRLPPSISALQNLQTLIINPSIYPISLPPQIWEMTQLRHLIIGAMILPPVPMVSGTPIKKLGHLQTLMTVENFVFTKEAIETIPNLKKLKIRCRGSEGSDIWELCCLNNLVHLCHIDELKIIVHTPSFSCVDSLWSNIVFPLKLRKLSLGGCRFSWDEITVVGSLPNLQVLRLREDSFVGEEWEPTKGEFKCLKFLLLEKLDLKYWQAEHAHFPRLEQLKIKLCHELSIPLKIGDISTLRVIDVYESNGARDSAIQIQEQQREYGKDQLEVHVYE